MMTTDQPFHMQGIEGGRFRRWANRSITEKRTVSLRVDPALSGDLVRLTGDVMYVATEFYTSARNCVINEGAFLDGF